MAKKQAKSRELRPPTRSAPLSKLEHDLAPVLAGGDRFLEITRLLSQLTTNEKHVFVTSYPASNAGVE